MIFLNLSSHVLDLAKLMNFSLSLSFKAVHKSSENSVASLAKYAGLLRNFISSQSVATVGNPHIMYSYSFMGFTEFITGCSLLKGIIPASQLYKYPAISWYFRLPSKYIFDLFFNLFLSILGLLIKTNDFL